MSVYSGDRSMAGRTRAKVKGQVAYNDSENGRNAKIGPRSQSLTTLQTSAVIQPRMAQLETLEAKMASIEVSLSRRRKCIMGGGTRSPRPPEAPRDADTPCRKLRSTPTTNTGSTFNLHNSTNIQNSSLFDNNGERQQLECRLQRLKQDADSVKLTIKTLKLALDKLDITDNIDTRIQQAELEFQLGKEELNLLTLLEDTRTTQSRLDELHNKKDAAKTGQQFANSLYAYVLSLNALGRRAELLAARVPWTPTEPVFAVSQTPDQRPGLKIEWARQSTALRPGDRLLELNGRLVPAEGAAGALGAAGGAHTLHLTVLRATERAPDGANRAVDASNVVNALRTELSQVRDRADDMQRTKDELKADNIRLTHRISYLEEQVSELLSSHNKQPSGRLQVQPQSNNQLSTTKLNNCQNVTNINIGASNVQLYQRASRLRATGLRIVTDKDKKKKKKKHKDDPEGDEPDYEEQKLAPLDYTSEPVPITSHPSRKRPTPPKKPIRLSLNHLNQLDKSPDAKLSANSVEMASTRSSGPDAPGAQRRASLNQPAPGDIAGCEARVAGSVEGGSGARRNSVDSVESAPLVDSAGTRKRTYRGASVGMRWHQEIAAVAVRVRQRQAAKWC